MDCLLRNLSLFRGRLRMIPTLGSLPTWGRSCYRRSDGYSCLPCPTRSGRTCSGMDRSAITIGIRGGNWVGGFVPECQFEEVGVINNGNTAFIAVAAPDARRPHSWPGRAESGGLEVRNWRQHRFRRVHGGTGRFGRSSAWMGRGPDGPSGRLPHRHFALRQRR